MASELPFSLPGAFSSTTLASGSVASPPAGFSARRSLADILGREALGTLSDPQRSALQERCAGHLDEFLALASEENSEIFFEGLWALGRRMEAADRLDLAQAIYQAVAGEDPANPHTRAQARLDTILGIGEGPGRAEFLLRRVARDAMEPSALFGMGLAGATFRLTRLSILTRLSTSLRSQASLLPYARLGASLLAFGAEATVFPLATRAANAALGREQAWTAEALGHELAGSFLVLGGLKLAGAASTALFNRVHGVNPLTGEASRLLGISRISRPLMPQVSMFGGILLGHQAEAWAGLRPHVDGASTLTDSLAMLLQFHVAGRLTHAAFGEGFRRWERELDLHTERLVRTPRRSPSPLRGEGWGEGWLGTLQPALATGNPGFDLSQPLMMESNGSGEGGGPIPPSPRSRTIPAPRRDPGNSPHQTWLRIGSAENPIHLPVSREFLPEAERLAAGMAATPTEMETVGTLLQRILQNYGNALSHGGRPRLLAEVFSEFHHRYVEGNDIHVVTEGLASRPALIAAYHRARSELGMARAESSNSALIRAARRGEAGLFAQFGGQANRYFGELKEIYLTYPEAQSFIQEMGAVLSRDANSPEARETGFLNEGMDVLSWLRGRAPSERYLASSAVSQPLIALTQLSHYLVSLRTLGMQPGELARLWRGTTGHSQGIMSSVVVAASATEAAFTRNSAQAVRYLLWQGLRMAEAAPETTLHPEIVAASEAAGDGRPTPMLGILKLSPELVGRYVEQVNRELPAERPVEISLINGPRAVVVSGHPESLHRLREALRRDTATEDQARVPFSQRKLELTTNYFEVYGPYHTRHYMAPIPEALARDMTRLGIRVDASDQSIPVYSTETGENLQNHGNLTAELIRLQSLGQVNWPRAMGEVSSERGITHVVDFGPGETAGIGAISARLLEGRGVQMILGGSLQSGRGLLDKAALFDARPESLRRAPNWGEEFRPRLVRLRDGGLMVDNHFTRSYGRPPVIQAGMTPTSANAEFTGAVVREGFHAELAGGGQHDEAYFRRRVGEIVEATPPGEGFHVNLLFLNQFLWGFQYPLVQVLAREGQPIEGVTVAAGVPSVERASEVIRALGDAGVRHVAFKPGSRSAIQDVVRIAEANLEATIMLQWTGGRGGGHHSFEDVHDPILQSYAQIRARRNIVLVFGSGVGDAADSLPYMTGEWSERQGFPRMPFDGVLLASRLMASREAQTAPEAKELIVATPGIANPAEWEGSYERSMGGVRTVVSELGEPIHKIATRGIELWHNFDQTYFLERDPARR